MLPLVTGAITLASSLALVAERILAAKKAAGEVAGTVDNTLATLGQMGTRDLVTFTKVTRMEPLVLLDDRLKFDPSTPEILQVLTSLIAGYYTQAFALLGQVDGIDVIGTLDKLNPSRTGIGLNNFEGDLEKDGLHKFSNQSNTPLYSIGLEALTEVQSAENKPVKIQTDKNVVADISAPTNLALGKMIKVTLSANGNTIEIPITIRVKPVTTGSDAVTAILAIGTTKNTVAERWNRFKAGELTFTNLATGDDVIRQHKKILVQDTSGFYAEITRRARGNAKKGALSGNLSLATDSNVVMISSATALDVGRELGGELSNFRIREAMFAKVYSNMLIIVDDLRGMVSFYYRGESLPNVLSLQDIKLYNKGSGPDIMSIFSAFAENKIPSL
ncbi:hypothetical protein RAY_292 [Erwinia phage vB_EamM_RAY]|uniref:Virion structural protein n=10 Tax=Agricanvirus TaxID=1984776 RepID=A0A173GEI9_9CAUD|nr:hypothetical protein Ea357_288 [Erwinia phage Ea35-70]YP_009605441.1 putative virion structural protein [Erwinia phage vB_EamM_Deimos-Minion]YP_009605758.1 hypothetical protein FDH98_gp226 [Erwinia phage vB_EamM_RAY]YP_009606080.1 hypothetical protein FDH99_gp229 [Erwinia phage vB_EamM_Simmy50]YP_009606401.1 putative virion structural protein [Erwinia phage vB_EamM_Special G]YP_009622035.1 putative virion structural protein [Erwinia phage vB_EamM_Desertfox]AUG86081.1 putative virion struct